MILSSQDIIDEVSFRNIEVQHAFLPIGENGNFIDCSAKAPEEWEAHSRRFLGTSIVCNRLSLRLGPLVKRLSGPKIAKKNRYAGLNDIHDLRNGPCALKPEQAVLITVNEWLRLGNSVAGMVFARSSSFATGLAVKGFYINALWEGVLLLQVINYSDHTVYLNLGDEIAAVCFLRSSTAATADTASACSGNYSKDWQHILDHSIDPFMAKGGQPGAVPVEQLLTTVRELWNQAAAYVSLLSIAVMLAIVVAGGRELLSMRKRLAELDHRADLLSSKSAVTGVTLVPVSKGFMSGLKDVVLARQVNEGISIARSRDPLYSSFVRSSITQDGPISKLSMEVVLPTVTTNDIAIEVEWAVVP